MSRRNFVRPAIEANCNSSGLPACLKLKILQTAKSYSLVQVPYITGPRKLTPIITYAQIAEPFLRSSRGVPGVIQPSFQQSVAAV